MKEKSIIRFGHGRPAHAPPGASVRWPLPLRLKIRNVLVPTDFSPISRRALRYARPLAKRFGARITLLHVVPPVVYDADFGYGTVRRSVPNAAAVRTAARRLRSLARSGSNKGLCSIPLIRSGTTVDEIVKAARALKSDLVVMGERSMVPSKPLANPTMAEKAVRRACCPVLVVREKNQQLLRRPDIL